MIPPTTATLTAQQTQAGGSTTIASGSNGQVLPQGTINVASTTGFPSSGTLLIDTSLGVQTINYTGTSGGNQFTGCTGGTGNLATGQAVAQVPAVGAVAVAPVNTGGSIRIQLSGTWSGTVQFEYSTYYSTSGPAQRANPAVSWQALPMTPVAGGAPVTSATGNGTWVAAVPGVAAVRVRCSSFSSGAVVVIFDPSDTQVDAALPPVAAVIDSSGDVAVPSANAAATVTYNAIVGLSHVLSGVAWSYSGSPTGGNLQITDGGTVVFELDITSAGPGFVPFSPPKRFAVDSQVVITLAAGGSGVSGKVNALGHWEQ
jgi:hypothetical protein